MSGETVHILAAGRALCGLGGFPKDWPRGHLWVDCGQRERASCGTCVAALDVPLSTPKYGGAPRTAGELRKAMARAGRAPVAVKAALRAAAKEFRTPKAPDPESLLDRLACAAFLGHCGWGDPVTRRALERCWRTADATQRRAWRRVAGEVVQAVFEEPGGPDCLRAFVGRKG